MFKMFPPTFLIVPVAWLTLISLSIVNGVTPFLKSWGVTPATSWIVLLVQATVTLLIVTPAWRTIWRIVPKLNDWVYPDLNGEWDVELLSNYSRIDAVLKAANRAAPKLDMRLAPDEDLPPLQAGLMRARITQSWLDIDMLMWNPTGKGPIRESKTLIAEPFRGKGGRHGLTYVFEQENVQQEVSDDRQFRGAVWLVRNHADLNVLSGQMWSDRVWRRGMNTAAELRFVRRTASVQTVAR